MNSRVAERKISCGVAMHEIQRQNGHQHQDAADHREEHEFHRCINAPFASPYADQEVHGNQHHFPEQVEQEEVQCGENTNHAGFEQQHEEEVLLRPVADGPRSEEHTSELQSQSNLVCRLLLEKKKNLIDSQFI